METTIFEKEPSFYERNRNLIKGFLIGFLTLLMLIPAALVSELVNERKQRQEEVVKEVSSKWANNQTITGPILSVPYKVYTPLADGNVSVQTSHFYLLPETLNIDGQVVPEERHRSLYTVALYRSHLKISGSFLPASAANQLKIAPENVMWAESQVLMGIDDVRGLEDEVTISWNAEKITMEAGVPNNKVVASGLYANVAIDPAQKISFSLDAKVKGSSNLYFTPIGKTTEASLRSTWKNPAFDGQYLPDKTADISNTGFTAHWKVMQVSRSYPQSWVAGTEYDIEKSAFGVKLIQPADGYAKTQRSVKYAILFIGLTFFVFFFLEMVQKRQVHPLQYLLVGFALCIFYTLLLSISEYTGFNPAYFIAATATVSLIGSYIWSIFKSGKIAGGFICALAGLYGYIFILIQLEDYALLFGSIGLFIILAVIMYYSRKIDWYAHDRKLPVNA